MKSKRLTLPIALLCGVSLLIFVLANRFRDAGNELAYAYGMSARPTLVQVAAIAHPNRSTDAYGRLAQFRALFHVAGPGIDRFLQMVRYEKLLERIPDSSAAAIKPSHEHTPAYVAAARMHLAGHRRVKRNSERREQLKVGTRLSTFALATAIGNRIAARSVAHLLHLPISPVAIGLGFALGLMAAGSRPKPRFRSLPPGYFAHRPLAAQTTPAPAMLPSRIPLPATSPASVSAPSFGARRFLEF